MYTISCTDKKYNAIVHFHCAEIWILVKEKKRKRERERKKMTSNQLLYNKQKEQTLD